MNLIEELKKNPFVLAPMAGITDPAFRSLMSELGCGIVITELVSANGLAFGSEKTKKLMSFDDIQRPIGVQIFGENLKNLTDAARYVESEVGADFLDLNFGCPVPKVVKKGAGSAVLKDLKYLSVILNTLKSAVKIPLTIKIRTGWDAQTRNSIEVSNIAYNEGISWVAIHGRSRSQGYSGDADWSYIQEVKAKSKLPIIGNGDIKSPEKAVERLKQSACDAVMIGRGCLKNPWIFSEALNLWTKQEGSMEKDFQFIFNRLSYYLEKHFDERRSLLQTKKIAAWYSAGFQGSAQFRKNVFNLNDQEELNQLIKDYFGSLKLSERLNTNNESFLMGGHG